MNGKLLLVEISKIALESYCGTKVFRENGIVTLERVTKNGVFFIKEKKEHMIVFMKGFMVPAIYLPLETEDNQFGQLHPESWEEAMPYFPKKANGGLIPGLHPDVPYLKLIKDDCEFYHISKLSLRRANVARDRANREAEADRFSYDPYAI